MNCCDRRTRRISTWVSLGIVAAVALLAVVAAAFH
jgi:hypothetical protein